MNGSSSTSYETPAAYLALHVAMGAAAFWAPAWLALTFLVYQATQLALGRRFFFFSLRTEAGNSVGYTVYKLAQFAAGYGVAAMAERAARAWRPAPERRPATA